MASQDGVNLRDEADGALNGLSEPLLGRTLGARLRLAAAEGFCHMGCAPTKGKSVDCDFVFGQAPLRLGHTARESETC